MRSETSPFETETRSTLQKRNGKSLNHDGSSKLESMPPGSRLLNPPIQMYAASMQIDATRHVTAKDMTQRPISYSKTRKHLSIFGNKFADSYLKPTNKKTIAKKEYKELHMRPLNAKRASRTSAAEIACIEKEIQNKINEYRQSLEACNERIQSISSIVPTPQFRALHKIITNSVDRILRSSFATWTRFTSYMRQKYRLSIFLKKMRRAVVEEFVHHAISTASESTASKISRSEKGKQVQTAPVQIERWHRSRSMIKLTRFDLSERKSTFGLPDLSSYHSNYGNASMRAVGRNEEEIRTLHIQRCWRNNREQKASRRKRTPYRLTNSLLAGLGPSERNVIGPPKSYIYNSTHGCAHAIKVDHDGEEKSAQCIQSFWRNNRTIQNKRRNSPRIDSSGMYLADFAKSITTTVVNDGMARVVQLPHLHNSIADEIFCDGTSQVSKLVEDYTRRAIARAIKIRQSCRYSSADDT